VKQENNIRREQPEELEKPEPEVKTKELAHESHKDTAPEKPHEQEHHEEQQVQSQEHKEEHAEEEPLADDDEDDD